MPALSKGGEEEEAVVGDEDELPDSLFVVDMEQVPGTAQAAPSRTQSSAPDGEAGATETNLQRLVYYGFVQYKLCVLHVYLLQVPVLQVCALQVCAPQVCALQLCVLQVLCTTGLSTTGLSISGLRFTGLCTTGLCTAGFVQYRS